MLETLKVSQGLLDLLRQRRIFSSRAGIDRFGVGQVIGVHRDCEIEPYAQLWAGPFFPRGFGAFSYSRSEVEIHARIGRYSSLGQHIQWMGDAHPMDWASTSSFSYDPDMPAMKAFREQHDPDGPRHDYAAPPLEYRIGNDVWIGDGAMIASGVSIGDGAVVGARSLVLKDVPPYAVVVGSPARLLRMRFPNWLVERFLKAQWWRYAPDVLQRLPVPEPERFLDALEERLAKDAPRPITPVPLRFAELQAAALSD